MKKLLVLFGLLLSFLIGNSQYNPATGTGSNKPYAPAQAVPTDARSYYFDNTNVLWRQYRTNAELIAFLNLSKYRVGQVPLYIHIGGTLNGDGTFTGGYTREYWFKNNTTDTGLIVRDSASYPITYEPYAGAYGLDTLNWHSANYYNTKYAPIGGTGGSNINIGAGFRLAVPGTNNIKTVNPGFSMAIDSTSSSQALTFKFDSTTVFHTQGYNDLRYKSITDSNVIVNTAQQSGPVFSDNFARSSLGGNYTANGGTFTFPSSAFLHLSAGDGTFNNYIVRNQSISTHQYTDTVKFVPQIVNNTSFGVSIGVQSWQPGTKRDLLAQFSVANATLVGNITIYGQPDYPTAILVQSGSLSFSPGDTLLAVLVRNDNTVTATFTDLTAPASVTCTYTYPTTNVSGYLLHNTGLPVLYNNGGTNNVVLWKLTNTQSRTNDVIIGNSLVSYDASSFATSWPNLLYNARTDYSVVCGPGDRTAQALTNLPELLSYGPKKAFVDLGINDLLGSVSAATFSANYDSICHYLFNLHIPVYLISLSPTTTSVIAFNDTIQLKAIKYGFTYINVYDYLRISSGTTLAPIYDGGDGLHWSDAAHSLVASLLQPYRNRYSNNIPSGGAFALTTIGTTGSATYIGNILNIPNYAGLGGLNTGRIPVASSSSSLTDYAELAWDNPTKRMNVNGTLQVGDQAITHAGYNTLGVGGSAKSGAVDFYDNGNFISEFYTLTSSLNMFSNTTFPINIYTNGATTTPNIYAFSQKVGINTGSPDSSLTIAGGLDIKSGLIMPALASGNASPSQTGARVALNIDANGRVGTYTPSLETTLANGANLSNSYTTTLGANSWTMSENSSGRFKINGMQTASGTYTVLTKNADSSFTQVSLATLAAILGLSDTIKVVPSGNVGFLIGYTNNKDSIFLDRLIAGTNISISKGSDSSNTINVVGNPVFSTSVTTPEILGSGTPTIAAGSGAGSGPAVSISGTALSGRINVSAGATPAINSVICTVTMPVTMANTNYNVIFSPSTVSAGALLGTVFMLPASTTTFTLNSGATALTAVGVYSWDYIVVAR